MKITDCYYDANRYGLIDLQGTPLTSKKMKNEFNFVNWDFENIWDTDEEPLDFTPEEHDIDTVIDNIYLTVMEMAPGPPPGDMEEGEMRAQTQTMMGTAISFLSSGILFSSLNLTEMPPPDMDMINLPDGAVSFKKDGVDFNPGDYTPEDLSNMDPESTITIKIEDYDMVLEAIVEMMADQSIDPPAI